MDDLRLWNKVEIKVILAIQGQNSNLLVLNPIKRKMVLARKNNPAKTMTITIEFYCSGPLTI